MSLVNKHRLDMTAYKDTGYLRRTLRFYSSNIDLKNLHYNQLLSSTCRSPSKYLALPRLLMGD